jgi:hypothetical protein
MIGDWVGAGWHDVFFYKGRIEAGLARGFSQRI